MSLYHYVTTYHLATISYPSYSGGRLSGYVSSAAVVVGPHGGGLRFLCYNEPDCPYKLGVLLTWSAMCMCEKSAVWSISMQSESKEIEAMEILLHVYEDGRITSGRIVVSQRMDSYRKQINHRNHIPGRRQTYPRKIYSIPCHSRQHRSPLLRKLVGSRYSL